MIGQRRQGLQWVSLSLSFDLRLNYTMHCNVCMCWTEGMIEMEEET